MMGDEPALEIGDIAATVMLSPCVGGLLRTRDESNGTTLWSATEADFLLSRQGNGLVGRSLREEKRFVESGLLVRDRQTLMIQGRFPTQTEDGSMQLDGSLLRLEPAAATKEPAIDGRRPAGHRGRSEVFLAPSCRMSGRISAVIA